VSLRARKKEQKLARIEHAGRELFAERGFHATTTREIAKRSEIGAGTLFVYFPQKLDLLQHLFVEDIGRVQEQAFASLDPDLELVDGLMHVFGALY
jgi:AcrR family transcriptional regulator